MFRGQWFQTRLQLAHSSSRNFGHTSRDGGGAGATLRGLLAVCSTDLGAPTIPALTCAVRPPPRPRPRPADTHHPPHSPDLRHLTPCLSPNWPDLRHLVYPPSALTLTWADGRPPRPSGIPADTPGTPGTNPGRLADRSAADASEQSDFSESRTLRRRRARRAAPIGRPLPPFRAYWPARPSLCAPGPPPAL